jgi:dephospho-CoA kinase
MIIIGLTGTNGSGKGTIAEFLIKKGFQYHSLSDVIRDELKINNLEPSRENLIKTGNKLRSDFGPAVLAEKIQNKFSNKLIVIDSIRNPMEINSLKKNKNFFLIALDADPEIRFKRVMKRGRNENADTLEKFIEIENREKSSDTAAQQIDVCMSMADFLVKNNTNINSLQNSIEDILSNITKNIKEK